MMLHGLESRQEVPHHGDSTSSESGTPPFIIFDILHGLALFLLLITYIAALISKSIVRMKTWFCLILSCIIYCVSFLVLVGHQGLGDERQPSFGLCIFQSGLIYAAPPTIAAAAVSFVVELYMRLSASLTATQVSQRKLTVLMFFSPIVHLIIFWEAVFYGLSNQQLVKRIPSGIYCHVDAFVPTTVTGITTGSLVIGMIILEVYTGHYLWKTRSGFAVLRTGSDGIFTPKLFIRVAVYTIVGLVGIIVDVFINTRSPEAGSGKTLVILAIIPLLVAILFGAQTNYLKVYMFWRKQRPAPIAVTAKSPSKLTKPKVYPNSVSSSQDYPERFELDVV